MRKRYLLIYLFLSLIIVLAAVSLFISLNSRDSVHLTENGDFRVYGKEIAQDEVQEQYSSLPPEKQETTTKEEIAEALATQELLLEEAEKKEIKVTNQEAEDFIQSSLSQFNMSEEEYQARLSAYGITEEQYKEQLKEQIQIAKLINQSIDPKEYYVSDEEVEEFMQAHQADYQVLYDENNSELVQTLKDRIRMQMEFQKKQELVAEYIGSLKD